MKQGTLVDVRTPLAVSPSARAEIGDGRTLRLVLPGVEPEQPR